MTLPVRISEEAEAEMAEAARWYETHRAGLGTEFLASVDGAVAWISETPRTGSRVPGLSDEAIRRSPVRRFPYHVVYLEQRTSGGKSARAVAERASWCQKATNERWTSL